MFGLIRIVVVLSVYIALFFLPSTSINLYVSTPSPGATIYGNTIIVQFDTPGLDIIPLATADEPGSQPRQNGIGQGHVLLMLDLQPVVLWDKVEPYALLNVVPGDHLLKVELVQNDSSSFEPPISQEIRFTSIVAAEPSLNPLPKFDSLVTPQSITLIVP